MDDTEDCTALIEAKCRALMVGYDLRYRDAPYIPIEVEAVTMARFINPRTNRWSRSFILAGVLDVVAKYHGKLILFDHKTTFEDISDPANPFWQQLVIAAQPSAYMLLKWLNGQKLDGAVWDVVRKPGIAPRKLTKPACTLAISNRRYYDQPLSDDTLAGLQTDPRETLEMYEARLVHDCTKQRPDWYFQRRSVPRLDSELHEYAKELWDYGQEILAARRHDRHGKNDGACMLYGSPCRFLGICSKMDRTDSDRWQYKVNVHEELPGLEGDGRDVLTNSRIRTFKACRRKHFYEYELGITRQDKEKRESLLFGAIWHAAQQAWWSSRVPNKESNNVNCQNGSATADSRARNQTGT